MKTVAQVHIHRAPFAGRAPARLRGVVSTSVTLSAAARQSLAAQPSASVPAIVVERDLEHRRPRLISYDDCIG